MPTCPLCKQEFATQQELNRHECSALVQNTPPVEEEGQPLFDIILRWSWCTPLVVALLYGICKALPIGPWPLVSCRLVALFLYPAVFLISLIFLCSRWPTLCSRRRLVVGVLVNGAMLGIMVPAVVIIVKHAGVKALFLPDNQIVEGLRRGSDISPDGEFVKRNTCVFRLPSGWHPTEEDAWADGMGHRLIAIRAVPIYGSLDDVVATIQARLKAGGSQQVYENTPFVAGTGMPAIKMTPANIAGSRQPRIFQYIFAGPGDHKIMFACATSLASDTDLIFDDMMRAVRFDSGEK